jgi:hypothetical protein
VATVGKAMSLTTHVLVVHTTGTRKIINPWGGWILLRNTAMSGVQTCKKKQPRFSQSWQAYIAYEGV